MSRSSLRTQSPSLKSKRVTSWSKLSRLRSKSSSGSASINSRKRCRTLSTQPLVRLRSSPWKRRSIECSFSMNYSVRSKRSWLRIWRDASLSAKLSSSNTFPRWRKRTLRIVLPRASYLVRSLTLSRTWSTRQSRPCSSTRPSRAGSERSTTSPRTSTARRTTTSKMVKDWDRPSSSFLTLSLTSLKFFSRRRSTGWWANSTTQSLQVSISIYLS